MGTAFVALRQGFVLGTSATKGCAVVRRKPPVPQHGAFSFIGADDSPAASSKEGAHLVAMGYARVYRRMWNDEKFRRLSSDDKLVVMHLLTYQSNRLGYFAVSAAALMEHVGCKSLPAARHRVETVCHTLGWPLDTVSWVVLVPSWWRYNRPDNKDAFKGYLRDVEDVPQNTLWQQFIDNARNALGTVYDTVLDTVSMPYPYPEPYPEPEHKPDPEPTVTARKRASRTEVSETGFARAVEKYPDLDVESIRNRLMAHSTTYRDYDLALMNWCKTAQDKGWDKRPAKRWGDD